MHAIPGDYRLTDPRSGRQWSVTATALHSGYRLLGGDEYESRGAVTASQVGVGCEPVDVVSLEGDEAAEPGDWIVTDLDRRVWVVDDAWFREHYIEIRRGRRSQASRTSHPAGDFQSQGVEPEAEIIADRGCGA